MHGLYRGKDRCYLVIEKDGKVLGGGGFSPLKDGDSRVCELQRMYFRPEIRGLGLGRRLVKQCVDAARKAGFHVCYVETMAGMKAARALYEKIGFQLLKAPLGATGHTFTDAWFRLDLK